MRSSLGSMVLALSLVGVVKAQDSSWKRAEKQPEAEKELVKYENDLVQAVLKGGSAAADFFDRGDAEDQDLLLNGKESTKARHVEEWKTSSRKMVSIKHSEYLVRVYGNGSTAVVTYRGHNQELKSGKVTDSYYRNTDVFAKQNGMWLRVLHHVNAIPQSSAP
jgi:Domain of unknown function (DUF4440)